MVLYPSFRTTSVSQEWQPKHFWTHTTWGAVWPRKELVFSQLALHVASCCSCSQRLQRVHHVGFMFHSQCNIKESTPKPWLLTFASHWVRLCLAAGGGAGLVLFFPRSLTTSP